MSAQERFVTPGGFTASSLMEDSKIYHTKKQLDNKETNRIVSKPDCFTEKTSLSKCYHQLENFSVFIIGKSGASITYVMREDSTPLTGADLITLSTIYEIHVMGPHNAGKLYEINSGNLWSLICDRIEDGPTWARIYKFKTSCDGQSAIIALIKHYRVNYHNNNECTLAYTMPEKRTYDKERVNQTSEMFFNRQIAQ